MLLQNKILIFLIVFCLSPLHAMDEDRPKKKAKKELFTEQEYQEYVCMHEFTDSLFLHIQNVSHEKNKELIKDLRKNLPDQSIQTKQGLLLLDEQEDPCVLLPKRFIFPYGQHDMRDWTDRNTYEKIKDQLTQFRNNIKIETKKFEEKVGDTNHTYLMVLSYNNQQFPEAILKEPEDLISKRKVKKTWKTLKKRYNFGSLTLIKICLSFINKNIKSFEKNKLQTLPQDLLEKLKITE